MLHPDQDLLSLAIVSSQDIDNADDNDGHKKDAIGQVKDLYFDDEAWAVRYLVVETGSWLLSRKVLISPVAAGQVDWAAQRLPIALGRDQIKNSPAIDTDMPVTRQHETDYLNYYSYPYYWGGMGIWGTGRLPAPFLPGYSGFGSATAARAEADGAQARADARRQHNDPHLRSCKAVVGYHIHASDGELGHVQGMLIDEQTWAIRYLVVSTSSWWIGHELLVAPQWIQRVSWTDRSVVVDMTRNAMALAPRYDAETPLTREMEIAVFQHHGRPDYWTQEEQGASIEKTPHDAVKQSDV